MKKATALVAGASVGMPAVLECVTYRHMAHSAPIFDENYREEDTADKRQEKDPIKKVRNTLLAAGVPEETLSGIDEETKKFVDESIDFAVKVDYPKKETLYTDLYAS